MPLLIALLIAGLLGSTSHAYAQAPKIQSFKSPSGKLLIELRGADETPQEVWIAPAGKPEKRRLLFSETDTLPLEVMISPKDFIIVVTWSGPSLGAHSEVFVRLPSGRYVSRHTDLPERAWEAFKSHMRLANNLNFTHLYPLPVTISVQPPEVVFELAGFYVEDGEEKMIDSVLVKYSLGDRRVRVVSVPKVAD